MTSSDSAAHSEAELLEILRTNHDSIVLAASHDADIEESILTPAFAEIVKLVEDGLTPKRLEAFRREGERLARSGVSSTHVIDGYLSLSWAMWEVVMDHSTIDREAVLELALRMMKGIDRATTAVVDGYVRYEVNDSMARGQHHRAVIEDVLTSRRTTPEDRARIRRRASRYGIDPDGHYRLVLIILARDGELAEGSLTETIRRLEPYVAPPSRAHGSGIRLPFVTEWHDHSLLIVARASWRGEQRLRDALPDVLTHDWLAVDSGIIVGVDDLREALHDIEHASAIAADLGRRGWIADSRHLALETMFLMDDELSRSVVHQELGPLLKDQRMGEELIETLSVYLRSRHNTHETARRMHLAPRTVTYRIRRVEELVGVRIDGDASARLGVALLVLHAIREAGRTLAAPDDPPSRNDGATSRS